jgi:membrane protease YdiL (CAAX protease family)
LKNQWVVLLYLIGVGAVALAVFVPALSGLSTAVFIGMFPLAAVAVWRSEGRPGREFGFRTDCGWYRWLAAGLAVGACIPAAFLAVQILGGWVAAAARVDAGNGFVAYALTLLLKMTLLGAVEEFVFRGFFLQALSGKAGVHWAMLLSSLLWALGHLASMVSSGVPAALAALGMVTFSLWGIALCACVALAERTLWLPYGLHLGINLGFSLLGWFFIIEPRTPQWWIGNPAWSPETGLLGTAVWLGLAAAALGMGGWKKLRTLSTGGQVKGESTW